MTDLAGTLEKALERHLLSGKHVHPLPLLDLTLCEVLGFPSNVNKTRMEFSKRRAPGEVEIIRLVDFIKSTGPSKASEVFPLGLIYATGRFTLRRSVIFQCCPPRR